MNTESIDSADSSQVCQGSGCAMRSASEPMSLSPWQKFTWHRRQKGIRVAVTKTLSRLARPFAAWSRLEPQRSPPGSVKTARNPEAVSSNVQAGDWVRVKSWPEIAKTLDSKGRHRGLIWMDSMDRFCGGEHRVLKVVNTLHLEESGEYRTLKNTVLLENVFCDGEDFYGCDRTCFHFWREVWLDTLVSGDRS